MNSVRISRSPANTIECKGSPLISIGASYTHIRSLRFAISKQTKRVVMYHSMLESLEGLENAEYLNHVYLGFNRISSFRPEDQNIRVGVLDLAGNPIVSLHHAPVCRELIVSSTQIKDLTGLREGIEIVRCGHSSFLESLKGLPLSVVLVECSCAPNLKLNFAELYLYPSLEEIIGDFGWWKRPHLQSKL